MITIRDRSRLKKGEHSQTYHHVDVSVAGICTPIVCEAHRHVKHANTRGSEGMPPRKF